MESDLTALHNKALEQYTGSFDIFGFPLHMKSNEASFMKLEEIVLGTQLANDFGEMVQFAVASYIASYEVELVCSIWIYIAVLRKKPGAR